MLQGLFHAWERRLAAATTDRVVRPFEWGLEWIPENGRGAAADPADRLGHWITEVMADSDAEEFPLWRTPEGEPVSCVEKIKVLNENLAELRALAQDALEDAVLMGADERQVREVLAGIVASLVNPYGQ